MIHGSGEMGGTIELLHVILFQDPNFIHPERFLGIYLVLDPCQEIWNTERVLASAWDYLTDSDGQE